MIWDVKFVCDCPQRESRLLTSMDRLMPLPRNSVLIWASSKCYGLEINTFSALKSNLSEEGNEYESVVNNLFSLINRRML